MSEFVIREAQVEDAAGLLAHLEVIAAEPGNGVSYSSVAELNMTEAQVAQMIEEHLKTENALYLIAETDGKIIGEAHCRGGRLGYVGTLNLTITIAQEWRGKGVGAALLRHMIDWCRASSIVHRLELYVFPNNRAAIRLYEKMGFQVEGNHRQSYFKEGKYLDMWIMGMIFDRD